MESGFNIDSISKNLLIIIPEAYSRHCLTNLMEIFAKIVISFYQLAIFPKSSIIDACHGPKQTLDLSGYLKEGKFSISFITYFAAEFLIFLHKFSTKNLFFGKNLSLMFEMVLNEPLNPVY